MKYQIKVYDKTKVFKKVINELLIKSEISFTAQINGWQWNINIVLDWLITDFIQSDIIEIYSINWSLRTLIYVWFIWEIQTNIKNFYETTLIVYGLFSLFNNILYNVSWNYTANININSYTIIQNIISLMNTNYNYFTISWISSIIANYDLNHTNCLSLVNELQKINNNYFYLDNYNLKFTSKPITATHFFTIWLDIEELNIDDDTTELVNSLILKYGAWTNTYNDTTSINTYWKKEKYIENTSLVNFQTADNYWNTYISENKNPKKKIRLVINRKFENYEIIKPWDTCKILNTKLNLNNNLQINKLNYTKDKLVIELEGYDNFINLIK